MFSSRVAGNLAPNRLTQAIHRARASARDLLDLTTTNPTAVGIEYPASIFEALGDPASASYRPEPLGSVTAREAVARDYERRGVRIPPDHIVLTASTSEAYSILFKLLCDPSGDAVMVPVPSYPLFEHLTALEGVAAVPYPLEYHGRWVVDVETLDERWSPAVRAVLAVSPNNPTGSVLTQDEIDALQSRCADRGAALIVDEVFADYPLQTSVVPAAAASVPALTFRLGGLSKSVGLPQMKLGWIAVEGPAPLVAGALERLEMICDTYLSVSTPVQVAAARLLSDGSTVRDRILARVRGNYAVLREAAASWPAIDVLPVEAGWSAVLRVPAVRSEEEIVIALLDRHDVLVHPGFFFDLPHEAFLVVSLLPPPDRFAEALRRLGGHSSLG